MVQAVSMSSSADLNTNTLGVNGYLKVRIENIHIEWNSSPNNNNNNNNIYIPPTLHPPDIIVFYGLLAVSPFRANQESQGVDNIDDEEFNDHNISFIISNITILNF